MKITILCVGKIKEKFYRDAIAEYEKRLSRYCKLEIIEVVDEKTPDNASELVERQIKEKEAERMEKYLKEGAIRVKTTLSTDENKTQLRECAFLNPNGDLVTIFINNGDDVELYNVNVPDDYNRYEMYSTNINLIDTQFCSGDKIRKTIKIPKESISTIIYKK